MSGLGVTYRGQDRLVLERSRFREFFALVLSVSFVCFWYFMLGVRPDATLFDWNAPTHDWMWWLGVVAPVVLLPRIFRAVRVVLLGERWEFAGRHRVVRRNGNLVLRFDEIREVEMERTRGHGSGEDEVQDKFRLLIRKKDGGHIELDKSDHDGLVSLSRAVADVVGVDVFFTGV